MICFFFLFCALSYKQLDKQPIIIDGGPDLYASEFVFISTACGIYAFDRNTATWSRISQVPEPAWIIGLDEGVIWIGAATALASADIRINDWLTYQLPDRIEAVCFDDKYLWVGGGFGIKRLDKYTETWEDIAGYAVRHSFSEKNDIWFATDSGCLRYRRDFDRLEFPPDAPRSPYYYIINTPGRIWFIAPDRLAAMRKDVEQWSQYPRLEIVDYAGLGDSIFAVSQGMIYFYDPKVDYWQKFRDLDGINGINGVFADDENILLATDQGLLVYNHLERSRRLYNQSNGLEDDSLVDVYQDSRYIYVVNRHNIEYLDTETDIWYVERLTPSIPRGTRRFRLDDEGVHARLFPDTDLMLQGRAYYSMTSRTDDFRSFLTTDRELIDLRLMFRAGSNRQLTVYYDDTDQEQVRYGYGYRGSDQDLLYRSSGGYLNSEYYEFDLVPEVSILGANAKLRNRGQGIDLQAGRLQSRPQRDFFTGRNTTHDLSIRDIDYCKYTFYTIAPVTRGYDTVFVDDRAARTNDCDTRIGYTVGGISGDFDPLINGLDYFIDYEKGIIHFLGPRRDSDVIVLLINDTEIVLQSDMVKDRDLENVYLVGPSIIPNSFFMTIADTLGSEHPLAEFGLDRDGDGRVDNEFIQYDLGYLSFPVARPFPDPVYDEQYHCYTMEITFLSLSNFYYLSQRPIAVNSEIVYVDGQPMTVGSDYIIDYTSGILLFMRPDIVSEFSEIEVYYSSVDRSRDELLLGGQANIIPGPGVNIAPGVLAIEDERIFFVSGRVQAGVKDKNFRFTPQLALNDRSWAHDYQLNANYQLFGLNAEYQGFEDDFEAFGLERRRYGSLRHRGIVAASIGPFYYLRFSGRFQRDYQTDSLANQVTAQYTYGRVDYLNPGLPNGSLRIGRDDLPDGRKDHVQANLNYDLQILGSKLRIGSTVRRVDNKGPGADKTLEYIMDTNLKLPFGAQADVYWSVSNLYDEAVKEKGEDELHTNLNMDIIPGFYYTGNYSLLQRNYFFDDERDLFLKHYLYNNLNIAPGRWYSKLSLVNFSLGIGDNFYQFIDGLPLDYRVPYFIFEPRERVSTSSVSHLISYYAAVQCTPFSNLLVWIKHTLNRSGLAYYNMPDLRRSIIEQVRVEYEPGTIGRFVATWDQEIDHRYPVSIMETLYLEWNRPWSSILRTRFYSNYHQERLRYGGTEIVDNEEMSLHLEELFRLSAKNLFTIDIGLARHTGFMQEKRYSILPGCGVDLNLFTFLYLKWDYQAALVLGDEATHTISLKIAGQF